MAHRPPSTVHRPPSMFHGSWFMVHGSWFMVHGSWFMVHGSWFMFHGSCFMFHVSCFMFHVSCFMVHESMRSMNVLWLAFLATPKGQRVVLRTDDMLPFPWESKGCAESCGLERRPRGRFRGRPREMAQREGAERQSGGAETHSKTALRALFRARP